VPLWLQYPITPKKSKELKTLDRSSLANFLLYSFDVVSY